MPWCLRKPPVVVCHELSGKGVGGFRRADFAQPQLFDQPILKRQMCTLHATLGRTGVGADARDVELVHRTPELRLAVTANRIFVVNAKHAGFVAVECQRFTVLLQIAAGGVKIGERGLRFYEVELHQAAGCVVNINQQRAGGAAILKPAMIAAVNLYKFANAGATIPWLLDPRRSHFPGDPKSRSNHQLTHGLFSQHNVMELG